MSNSWEPLTYKEDEKDDHERNREFQLILPDFAAIVKINVARHRVRDDGCVAVGRRLVVDVIVRFVIAPV